MSKFALKVKVVLASTHGLLWLSVFRPARCVSFWDNYVDHEVLETHSSTGGDKTKPAKEKQAKIEILTAQPSITFFSLLVSRLGCTHLHRQCSSCNGSIQVQRSENIHPPNILREKLLEKNARSRRVKKTQETVKFCISLLSGNWPCNNLYAVRRWRKWDVHVSAKWSHKLEWEYHPLYNLQKWERERSVQRHQCYGHHQRHSYTLPTLCWVFTLLRVRKQAKWFQE